MTAERPHLVAPAPPAAPPDLRRLRWRARRGLLENDILVTRFLDRQGDALEASQAEALARLLDLPEAALFDLLLGRCEPTGALDQPEVRAVLQGLRAAGPDPI